MTVSEDVAGVANRLTATLPPAFLALLCINLVFVLGLLWFLHDASVTRIQGIVEIFKTCSAVLTNR